MSPESVLGLASVIIATCDREKMLVEAIRSALNQTHENVEILVVDDGDVRRYLLLLAGGSVTVSSVRVAGREGQCGSQTSSL